MNNRIYPKEIFTKHVVKLDEYLKKRKQEFRLKKLKRILK